jgi:pimeloyl-ACP methyl ester carboxylesterase
METEMRILFLSPIVMLLYAGPIGAQDHKYPVEDFFNRSIELPIDHEHPEEGTFFLYYQLASNFNFNRPTLFFFQDIAQEYGMPGEVDDLAKSYHFFDHFNVVRYQIRGREYSYIELKNPDGSVQWEKAFKLLSANQVIEDIERIRRDVFKEKPETKILLFGRSGGGFLIQRYLTKYSEYVHRAFIRAAPNPIIMKRLGYPESRYFYSTLNDIDATLYAKLKAILNANIVPDYQLFWILKTIPYASENAGEELKNLIEELYSGKKNLYDQYLQKKGFDFSQRIKTEKDMSPRDLGIFFAPVEVSADYMIDPDPEFIDPFYGCLKKLSEPYLKLIKAGKVAPPTFPPLEKFGEVETEIFYLAGRHDHVSDYRIGIELGKYFKNYEFFIADDNHTMTMHQECYPLLRNTFFTYGIGSKELQAARRSLKCKEWKIESGIY